MTDPTLRFCSGCGGELPADGSDCPKCDRTVIRTDSPSTPAPVALPGYRAVAVLGQGGMGQVLLARDEELERLVAIKLIVETFAGSDELKERFVREARTMASIEHPNVVRVYSFGRIEETAFLVMEYVEGESLAERIRREGPMRTDEAIRIAREAVLALGAAWEKRIVHRDIKPSNILLAKDGSVRVADFGLAKPLDLEGSSETSLTASGYLIGTPHYIAPEQAKGELVDFRADEYSLGIVLYEMLTGERPFVATTPFAVVAKHLHEPMPSLAAKRPDVPLAVENLVRKMTAKEPEERPESYDVLMGELSALDEAQQTVTLPSAPPTSVKRASWRRHLLSVAVALLAVLGALSWYLFGGGDRGVRPATPQPQSADSGRTRIVVSPFSGPDSDSEKEGRIFARLVVDELRRVTKPDEVAVEELGRDREPIRTEEEARSEAARAHAEVVIWGDVLAVAGETEIVPRFTLILPKPVRRSWGSRHWTAAADRSRDPGADVAMIEELAAEQGAVRLDALAEDQIALRRSAADDVGDMVLIVLGTISLEIRKQPEAAMEFFGRASESSDSLRVMASALLRTREDFVAATPPYAPGPEVEWDESTREVNARVERLLRRALEIDPESTSVHASLADFLWETGRYGDALAHLRRAGGVRQRNAILVGGELWTPEEGRLSWIDFGRTNRLPYLLKLDPDSLHVEERRPVSGPVVSMQLNEVGELEVVLALPGGPTGEPDLKVVRIDDTSPYDSHFSNRAIMIHLGQTACFLKTIGTPMYRGRVFVGNLTRESPECPDSIRGLREQLESSKARDETNPWNLLGLSIAREGEESGLEDTRSRLLSEEWDVHYYELFWMAGVAYGAGDFDMARALHAKGLARRARHPQPLSPEWYLDAHLVNPTYRVVGGLYEAQRSGLLPADALSIPTITLPMYYTALTDWRSSFRGVEGAELYSLTWEDTLRANGIDDLADREKEWRREKPDEIPARRSLTENSSFYFALAIIVAALIALLYVVGLYFVVACAELVSNVRGRHGSLRAGLIRDRWMAFAILLALLVPAGMLINKTFMLVALVLVWPAMLLSRSVVVFVRDVRRFRTDSGLLWKGSWIPPLIFVILFATTAASTNGPDRAILSLLAWGGFLIGYTFVVVREFFVARGVAAFGGRRLMHAVAVFAMCVFVPAAIPLWLNVKSGWWHTVPYGLSDSLGSSAQRAYWQQKADESGDNVAAFVAGIACQLSGDMESARRWYSGSSMPAAATNLRSLTGDSSRSPAVMPTFDQIVEAAAAHQSPLSTMSPVPPEGSLDELRPAALMLDLLAALGLAALIASFGARTEPDAPRTFEPESLIRFLPTTRRVLEGRPLAALVCAFFLIVTLIVTIAPIVQIQTSPDELFGSAIRLDSYDLPFGHHLSGFAPWECAAGAWFIAASILSPVLWIAAIVATRRPREIRSSFQAHD